jgi:hypothetical protein
LPSLLYKYTYSYTTDNKIFLHNGVRFYTDKYREIEKKKIKVGCDQEFQLATGLAKNMFFLFKTKHTVFFILNSFFCLKHVLNLVKKKHVLNQF